MRKKCNARNGDENILLKKKKLDSSPWDYFSKWWLLYTNICNDIMPAHGTLIHEYTADQMISFQITFNQKSTKS